MSEGRNKYNVQGISFRSAEFLNTAKARAAALRMSFSHYVNYLIEQDLKARKAIVLDESEDPHGNTLVAREMMSVKASTDPKVKQAAAALATAAIRKVTQGKEAKVP